jgi:UPF0176 protein
MEQTIITFYQFTDLPDFQDWKDRLEEIGEKEKVLGTIILAKEGINATICGPDGGVSTFMAFLRKDERFANMPSRSTFTSRKTFYRLRIAIRDEIVTLGVPDIDPAEVVGKYVEPEDWNDLIDDPEILLVDTRNEYEIELGTFKGALNPNTQNFSEWPDFVKDSLENSPKRKVAMFCTGGIRCEKASSHLLQNGFDEVYHLRGGILNYLQKVEADKSKWKGECFVFHHQVSVTHGLKDGEAVLCFGCRCPITNEDLSSPHYEQGVSCPKCNASLSDGKRESLRERQRQIELSRQRSETHIGHKMPPSQSCLKTSSPP